MTSKILDIHSKLQSGKITCTALVKEKLAGLKKNEYNSVNSLLEETALQLAEKVDKKIANKETIGILEGIPFGVKDVFLLQGTIASSSCHFLEKYISPYTATAIQKLLDAGAIPIVKENCDSFGHGSTSENTIFGSVKNAFDTQRVAGGSSGGSCVNVAKDYTVFSIGGDTGGSIRQPAGYNKVYGLKPTYGRVSRYGIMAYASSTDCVGPIASSLEDIRIVMNVISGKDLHDQTTYEPQPIGELNKIFDKKKIKLGYYKEFLNTEGIDKEIKSNFLKLIKTLSDKGFTVQELSCKNANELVSTYYALAMAETASNLARLDGSMYGARVEATGLKESYAVTRSEKFTAETKRRIVGGNQVLSHGHADEIYNKAVGLRNAITEDFISDLKEVDLLISPVSPTPPPKIGESLEDPLSMYLSDIYTIGFSLAGLPTLAMPVATATGIQISANKNDDELILRFANHIKEFFV